MQKFPDFSRNLLWRLALYESCQRDYGDISHEGQSRSYKSYKSYK